ncbi:MAG: HIT family protein [Anaerolineales bacterium]|jgi:histidine triad (HIT) family protein
MATDPSCIFCRIIAGRAEASLVHQDDWVAAFMDIRPVAPGHLLVVPKQHTPDLKGLDEVYARQMIVVGRRLALALRQSGLLCQGVNLYLADGAAAGQTVFHVHLHVIPRFQGDGFRVHFPSGYGIPPSRSQLDDTAAMIKAALKSPEGGED